MRGDDAGRRWLICIELQRDGASGVFRSADRSVQLDNCRGVLALAREQGWPVVHVHMRRPAAERGLAAARPLAGFEPLPSEAVFFRDGGPNSVEPPFWRMGPVEQGSEALVLGFVHDRGCADGLASLSRSGVQVVLVEDALGGRYAHGFIAHGVEGTAARDLLDGEGRKRRPLQWLRAANAP